MSAAAIIGIMALVTALLRFLPFLVFGTRTPPYVAYLGKVLPAAIIGMLAVFCLKDTNVLSYPHGIPELTAAACVVLLQVWKRNAPLSILAGTLAYMALIRFVF